MQSIGVIGGEEKESPQIGLFIGQTSESDIPYEGYELLENLR